MPGLVKTAQNLGLSLASDRIFKEKYNTRLYAEIFNIKIHGCFLLIVVWRRGLGSTVGYKKVILYYNTHKREVRIIQEEDKGGAGSSVTVQTNSSSDL